MTHEQPPSTKKHVDLICQQQIRKHLTRRVHKKKIPWWIYIAHIGQWEIQRHKWRLS